MILHPGNCKLEISLQNNLGWSMLEPLVYRPTTTSGKGSFENLWDTGKEVFQDKNSFKDTYT